MAPMFGMDHSALAGRRNSNDSCGQGGLWRRVVRHRTIAVEGDGSAWEEGEELTWAKWLNDLFEGEPEPGSWPRYMANTMMMVIFMSILAFILQTVPSLAESNVWTVVDYTSFVIFTLEYSIRLAVCNAFDDQTRCQFIRAPSNVIDLLSLMPVFLLDQMEAFQPMRVLRSIRLMRVFRVLKLSKYSVGTTLMVKSLMDSTKPLAVLMFLLGICVMLFSSLIYHAEKLRCPNTPAMSDETFRAYREACTAGVKGWSKDGRLCCDRRGCADDFTSITDSVWFVVVTMCTVGYGDRVPRTFMGRVIGCLSMIAGIVLISLPVAIVGSKFQFLYELNAKRNKELEAIEPVAELRQEGTLNFSHVPSTASTKTRRTSYRSSTTADAPPGAPAEPSMRHEEVVRQICQKLKTLENKRTLSLIGRGQVSLLLEMFDHIERIDKRLLVLREKDAQLDKCIQDGFLKLTKLYGKSVRQGAKAAAAGRR